MKRLKFGLIRKINSSTKTLVSPFSKYIRENNLTELKTDYMSFIHTSRYARWVEKENRRETWSETVDRYIQNVVSGKVDEDTQNQLQQAIKNTDIMPSMRALMTAGEALNRDNTCAYNCAYLTVDNVKSFDEAMFILLCGTGVGFSIERQYVQKLPEVPQLYKSETTIVVHDSKEGWAKGLRQLISLLYAGEIAKYDTSRVRPAGARLKVFGGRASGPGPLEELFRFIISTFSEAQGRKLSSMECHDIMCKIGEVVVVGGVRRSAMISLSNLSDDRLRHAKNGQWWENNPQRALSNNSVAYTERPEIEAFLREWTALVASKNGERGIINRVALKKQAARNGRRKTDYEFGVNPCAEIILRPNQFC
jgi:ribonucleoside-triphosphate reductase